MRRHGGLFFVWVVLLGSVLWEPLPAWADASGCTFHPNTRPSEDALCVSPGSGCYYCIYSYTNQPGWTDCSESPDGSISYCIDDPLHQPENQYGGAAAPPESRERPGLLPIVISGPR